MKTTVLVLAALLAMSLSGPADVTAAGLPGAGPDSAARPAVAAAAVQPGAGWRWPLAPEPEVLRRFDPPARPWLSGHRGVDLRAARHGTTVTSPAAGTVSFVGIVVDRPVITVDHGHGLKSSFEPVSSSLGPGTAVAAGDTLGTTEPGHCAAGPPVTGPPAPGERAGPAAPGDPVPCVHWGVRRGGAYVDPLALITDLRPSVLLPPLDPWPE